MTEGSIRIDGIQSSSSLLHLDNGRAAVQFDLQSGTTTYTGANGSEVREASVQFRWQGRMVGTHNYRKHTLTGAPVQVMDGFGKGVHVTILHEMEDGSLPSLLQHCFLYEEGGFVLIRAELSGSERLKINRFAVIQSSSVIAPAGSCGEDELTVLRVPFDNDKWVRYAAYPLPCETESYEASAIYRRESRQGLVVGSLTHDLWKTGIRVKGNATGQIENLEVFGGAASELTRDSLPHGYVTGSKIVSPLVWISFESDYRNGLEAFGRANAIIAPPLEWKEGVPFGWNSWSAAADRLDYDLYAATSDFFKTELPAFRNEGTAYVNFDSFWTNLTQQQIKDAVDLVHGNGHKAGTYWTPFAFWGGPSEFDREVEGTGGRYTYKDLLLRDSEGEVLPDLDGGLAIDPTHPGALQRIDWYMDQFIAEEFDYIKLDFMGHGALEGTHHDPAITTGMAAYHFGLSYLAERLSPERVGRPFFINLSIAPIFPHQFAHSRRVSCDAFGTLHDTEYMLNSLTHGWWLNDAVYRFNDPDHCVLYKSFNHEATTRQEGRSRLTASVISGTVFLLGDDYRVEEAASRACAWLSNESVLEIARLGKTFVPIDSPVQEGSANIFALHVNENSVYVAVFNYDAVQSAVRTVDVQQLGLEIEAHYEVFDLWEQTQQEGQGNLTVNLESAESKLFKIKIKNGEVNEDERIKNENI
ncbi:alpha-galactosidase [Paenibacillus sp. GCM10012307]|uniref:Alpha-galactosidase n=1 Tax=Paenibacillus roseus TaxID=2798579 RepID=A0A934J3G8_9BACL|nr:alpha-galactosidase [Paenibacillus roseus]MBJ6360141.1 alpha-galactosidase [Paenibacillus roseus]